jgi:cell division protein FtsB
MAKNWAIIIGINGYTFLPPLKWATRDAQMMAQFLKNNHFKVWHFSTKVSDSKMQPSRACIRRFLNTLKQQELDKDDNFWLFFSGHGLVHDGEDYLMPMEGDPDDIDGTAIPTKFVIDQLKKVHAGNIYLFLDACRNKGNKSLLTLGDSTIEEARSKNIIVFFSCSHGEFSYEIDSLKHGSFTCALLEGLKNPVNKSNLQELASYVNSRVAELNSKHKKSKQSPCLYIETITETSGAIISFFPAPENDSRSVRKKLSNFSRKRLPIVMVLVLIVSVFSWLYQQQKAQNDLLTEQKDQNDLLERQKAENQSLKAKNKKLCKVSDKDKPEVHAICVSSDMFFLCQNVNGIPTTVAFSSDWNNQPRQFIRWVEKFGGNTPQKRCKEVTEKLNVASGNGKMYLTFGTINGQNAICTTDKLGNGCQYLLFTIKPGQDPKLVLNDLFSLSDRQFAGRPLRQ